MKILKLVILVLLVLMSLAAGVAKIMQMPQEMKFFEDIGLSLGLLVPFGVVQVIGGVLAAIPKTRKLGLIIMPLVFLGSAVMVFMSGNMGFAAVSLIPAGLAGALAWASAPQFESAA